MKIVCSEGQFEIQLGKREKQVFFELLQLYPCIPSAAPGAKRPSTLPVSSQRLLDEALAEQRAQNRQQVQTLLSDPKRWRMTASTARLKLPPSELEWLLQILNDIRVGSWIRLGSPEPENEKVMLTEATAPHFWAMELAGNFEMQLLAALQK